MTSQPTLVTSFVDGWLGHSSHLVDLGDGSVLVIDPARIPTAQINAARARGLSLAFTADTHTHADYISGSPDLAELGTVFIAPSEADLDRDYVGVSDGDELAVGHLRLRAIATPGHTRDHLCLLLSTGATPVALFSGGSLMVGTVGRTDLLGDDQRTGLARELYHSLHERIMVLPDDLPVYPTHGEGSFCAAAGGGALTTTIGRERATNPLLAVAGEEEFVDRLLSGFGPFPTYFRHLPELNRRGVPHYESVPALDLLVARDVVAVVDGGGIVVDARPAAEFAAAHIPGSISIAARSVFAAWFGWLVPRSSPVVLLLDDDQDESEIVRYCLTIGHDRLAGRLTHGLAAWRAAGLPVAQTALIDAGAVPRDRPLIDVRDADEYDAGHVPAAISIALPSIRLAEVPEAPIVMCGKLERAMTAASLLANRGYKDVAVLDGGYGAWTNRTVRPTVPPG